MSQETETRVVEMKFDTQDFEQNAKNALSLLGQLSEALKLEGGAGSLNNLNSALGNFSLADMGESIDQINSKLGTLGAIGFSIIQNLTNTAIDFGKTFLDSLVSPLLEGGKQRALNIEQARFQFEGLGLDVEKAMQSALNAVRGTAYGLDAAAKVAAQLGASGLDVGEDMERVLRAIAGVAAMTNSSFEDIGQIFTTVSGNGRLMSIQLVQLATRGLNVAKSLADYLHVTEAEVRQMTTQGKISFETFAAAMDAAFGEHAQAANRTFEGSLRNVHAALNRIGASIQTPRLEAMRDIFNALIPVIDGVHAALMPAIEAFGEMTKVSSVKVVNFLEGVDLSVLEEAVPTLVEAGDNVLSLLLTLADRLGKAFTQIFPAPTAKQILNIVNAVLKFTEAIKMGGATADKFQRVFAGVFAVLDIGVIIIKEIVKLFFRLFGVMGEGSEAVLDSAANLGDFLVAIHDAIKNGEGLYKFFDRLGDVLEYPIRGIKNLLAIVLGFVSAVNGFSEDVFDRLEQRYKQFGGVGHFLALAWAKVAGVIEMIGVALEPVIDKLNAFFDTLAEAFQDSILTGEFNGVLDAINTVFFGGLLLLIQSFMGNVLNFSAGTGIIANIKNTLIGLTRTFYMMQAQIQANVLLRIAEAILILAVAMMLLSMVDSSKLASSSAAMLVMLVQLMAAVERMAAINTVATIGEMVALSFALLFIATAIDILVIAVYALSRLDWGELTRGLSGVGALLTAMVVALRFMPDLYGMVATGAGILLIAFAIKVLASAVEDISDLSWDEIGRGLTGVAGLLAALTLFSRFAAMNAMSIAGGVGIILLASGIYILAQALRQLADLDWEELARGLTGIAGVLLALGLFTKFAGAEVAGISVGAGLLLLAGGIYILSLALQQLSGLSWEELARGLTGIAGVLLALGLFTRFANAGAAGLSSGLGILLLATSIYILAQALEQLAGLSWEELAKGLLAIGATLLMVALFLKAMPAALGGAHALLVIAASFYILAQALTVIGQLSIAQIVTGLLAFAGAIVVVAGLALALSQAIPFIAALGAALILVAGAIALTGAGIFLLATGLTMLAAAGVGVSGVLISIITTLLRLVPKIIETAGVALDLIIAILMETIPQIVELLIFFLVEVIDGIIELMPKIIELIIVLVDAIITVLVNSVPKMVNAGLEILIGILDGIANNIRRVVTTAARVITEFLGGIGDALPSIIQAGFDLILSFIRGITKAIDDNSEEMGEAGADLAIAVVEGMVRGIASGASRVTNAVMDLARNAWNRFKDFFGINSPSKLTMGAGEDITEGLAIGIDNLADKAEKSAAGVGADVMSGLRSSLSGLASLVTEDIDMTPVITPVLDLTNVRKNASEIDGLLTSTPMSFDTSRTSATAASSTFEDNQDTGDEGDTPAGTTYNFNQYNTSPKALSTADIYRNTNNQISRVRGGLPT